MSLQIGGGGVAGSNGAISVSQAADVVSTGAITASGQSVSLAVPAGMAGWAVFFWGTYAVGATIVWEASPDGGTTYMPCTLLRESAPTFAGSLTAPAANAADVYVGDIPAGTTHVRVRASAFGASGTISVRVALAAASRGVPFTPITLTSLTPGVTATNLGKAEDAAAASGDTGVFSLSVRNDALASPTSADGDYSQQSCDARGAQFTNGAVYLMLNIATNATTVVKASAGYLRGIVINTKGTVASTVTIYDNTAGSGTKIGTIDSLNQGGSFTYEGVFATGLTIVTTGAPDITVSYR